MSPSRATLLAVAAAVLAVCVTAQTVFTEFEEVPSVSNDHLKISPDGKVCAKRTRARVCKAREAKNISKCPENPGYDFKLLPPCVAEEPCIKHSVSCGSVRVGDKQECLEYRNIRTCPQQCENGQLCDVAKVCKEAGGVTSCEWTRSCKPVTCKQDDNTCTVTKECVRYTEKASYVHRCQEGECEQPGERTRTCKSVPVCRVPEVVETVQVCSKWGRWKSKCTAWFPARITVLRKQYADLQESTTAAFDALKATKTYKNREDLRAEVRRATAEIKNMTLYTSYQEKQKQLSCVYSELSCRYFGGWRKRREHCRAWLACAPCQYAAFACRTSTQAAWKAAQCEKHRTCRSEAKFNPELHVVLTTDQ